MSVAQPVTLRPGVFQDRLIAPLREARHIVDRGHVMVKVCGSAGIDAAVGRATVVHELHRHRGAAVGVGCWRVSELAIRVDRRQRAEQSIVVGADQELQRLAVLVGGAGTDLRRPAGQTLGPASSQLPHRSPW